jgi:hypothetical protein
MPVDDDLARPPPIGLIDAASSVATENCLRKGGRRYNNVAAASVLKIS